ncbi:MAG: ABC transporter permease [Thermoplasmatota archaeon]
MGGFREPEIVTPLVAVLLIAAFAGAMFFSAPIWFYLGIVAVAVFTIGTLALFNRVLFKVGTRNIIRRKGLSAIVIGGLMVGTVIISSSLVVGDTMDEMIVSLHYDMFHETDEVIYGLDNDGSYLLINGSDFEGLKEEILGIEHVEGVVGELEECVSVLDLTSGQAEGGMTLIGYDPDADEFGSYQRNGLDVVMDIGPDEVYLDKKAAEQLNAGRYDRVQIMTRTGSYLFTVRGLIDSEGRGGWSYEGAVHMPLSTARSILGTGDGVNIIKVTNNGGVREGERYCEEVVEELEILLASYPNSGLEVQRDKATEIKVAMDDISEFSTMFLVFGSFSIFAGVILIINIFVMLGEERKREMGISRAVGMKRKHLRESFVYEGSIYAVISSVLGAFVGVAVAYMVLIFLDMIFKEGFGETGIIESFNFTPESIVISLTFGILITILTVSLTAMRISRLNIIRAIRNIPEPRTSSKSRKVFYAGIISSVLGTGLFIWAYWGFPTLGLERLQEAAVHLGVSIGILGLGVALRRFMGERLSISLATILLIIYWIVPSDILLPDLHPGDMEVFFMAGVFVVSSAIILFVYNSHHILGLLSRTWSLTGRPTATLKTASSYPMKNKFRTGMTIYMFALVVFTITVMSMIIGMISYNNESLINEQMGDIDLIGTAGPNSRISDIEKEIEYNTSIGMEPFEAVYSLSVGLVEVNTTLVDPEGEGILHIPWQFVGFDREFARCGWSFLSMLEGYDSSEELWKAVHDDPTLVILDNYFNNVETWGPGYAFEEMGIVPGDEISFRLMDGRTLNLTVAGILEEFIFPGIFVSKEVMQEEIGSIGSGAYIFSLKDGADDVEVARTIEKELGINMIILEDEVAKFTEIMEQFFDLFMAYMGLGLVVGIAGLGIITLRAVHERRQEIGMMRAIGFRRQGVTNSFIMEASFICIVGILIGSLLGMFVGYKLWFDEFKPLGYEFVIPWAKIALVGLLAFLSTALFTVPPSMQASRVTPAQALRYE